MEISNLYDAVQKGTARHYKPNQAPGNLYYISLQVLKRRADDTGDTWVNESLMRDSERLWYASQKDAIQALVDIGLKEAYEKRFTIRADDGVTVLNW